MSSLMLDACAMAARLPVAAALPPPPSVAPAQQQVNNSTAAVHVTFVPHQTAFLLSYNRATLPVLELRGTNRLTASLLLSCAQPELVTAVAIEFSAAHSGERVTERQSSSLSVWDKVVVNDAECFILRDVACCVSFLRGLPSKERKKAVCLSARISLRDGSVVQHTVDTPMFIRTNLVAKSSLVWTHASGGSSVIADDLLRVSDWANPDALRRLQNLARFQAGPISPRAGGTALRSGSSKKRRYAAVVPPPRRRLHAATAPMADASPASELVSAAIAAGARRITRAYAAHANADAAAGNSEQPSAMSMSDEDTPPRDMLLSMDRVGIIMPHTPDLPPSTSALLELGDDDDAAYGMAMPLAGDDAPPALMMDDDIAHFLAY